MRSPTAIFSALELRFAERMQLFLEGERGVLINDHPLKGKKQGLRAFSISGDIRVVYRLVSDHYRLLDIGTHNQVYGE